MCICFEEFAGIIIYNSISYYNAQCNAVVSAICTDRKHIGKIMLRAICNRVMNGNTSGTKSEKKPTLQNKLNGRTNFSNKYRAIKTASEKVKYCLRKNLRCCLG